MNISLAHQSYGKSQVCLSHIKRTGDQHHFVQIVVDVALEGDFDSAYTDGDNSKVVPTDTMKNSVYAIAKLHGVEAIETYAQHLAKHFFDSFDHITKTTISVAEKLWHRIDLDGEAHGHAFTGGGSEENTCRATASAQGTQLTSGLRGLQILKTTDSAFQGYLQDKYTTLKETSDRIFATTITSSWTCSDLNHDRPSANYCWIFSPTSSVRPSKRHSMTWRNRCFPRAQRSTKFHWTCPTSTICWRTSRS